ncbi:MAG: TrmH family RNA methyltransferase [Myxococcota bacterium]
MRRDDPDVYRVPDEPPLPAPPGAVIEALAPLVTERRLARIRQVAAGRTLSVVPVLERLADPHNGSAVLRSADAFGLQQVHVVEHPAGFLAAHRVSRGTDRWLDVVRHRDAAACAAHLHEHGYRLILAGADGELRPEDLARPARVALVLGHEREGPSEAMRDAADGAVAVPMAGFVESLNVSVAAGILLYAATRGRGGDLDASAQEMLTARFLFNSVKDAERVLRERGMVS